MQTRSTYHAGERAVQARAGQVAIADRNGVVIADTILAGARPFIEKQFMAVLASIDGAGAVWASILYGQPGFARSIRPDAVAFQVPLAQRDATDPIWDNIQTDPTIGMLFIELGSRRRYRINGMVQHQDAEGLEVTVREAYPNCPRYIQRRHLRSMASDFPAGDATTGSSMDDSVTGLINKADTLFVATHNLETGADASHRGGSPGFVQIVDAHTLRIPDFDGNSLFNTLGNMELNARTGLCIPDFEGQQLLQLTGRSRLLWDQDDPQNLTGGTRRFWEFEVERWILRPVSQKLEWEYLDASPFNPPAGA